MPKSTSQISPFSLGYRMPAEWEPHEGTWLGWPHELTDWPGKFSPIPWAFAEIVRHLARVEKVFLFVENKADESRVRAILKKSHVNLDAVTFFRIPTDRGWMRDSGPICVKNPSGEVAFNNFVFNGWAKYSNHKKDAKIVTAANKSLKKRLFLPAYNGKRVILEGGSIDVNGRGTLLTTEECLQSKIQERNPGFSKQDYEEVFRNQFGVTNVLWLKNGIAGDDTHGHVDDLSRFVNENTVLTILEENRDDANYNHLQENLALLKASNDQDGKPLRVEVLPMPVPVYFGGQRLPASYANFYIANKLVLVPVFNDANDRVALNIIAKHLPGREVVGIYCRDLVLGLGTIHCMTQQIPSPR
ncbi:MAG: agmatine deiminase family protein [Acidobacteria bacterium]|nr:agmatine deiminase family protein [Acidobacteriota bacterium]MBS1865635.1 agmatine deiminase family protein [Acidobacteriota bacterium]